VIPRLQRTVWVWLTFALAAPALDAILPQRAHAGSLSDALEQYLGNPAFRHATWGVEVQDAATGILLFETNHHRLLKPASNAKLFTGALALHALGSETRLATDFIPDGPISQRGILKGNLVVYGSGDFSFSARFHPGKPSQTLQSIVSTLRNAGLRRVNGDLVADDSLFTGTPFGNGWTWDDLQHTYGAEVSALSLDDNVLELEFSPGATTNDPVFLKTSPGASYFEFNTRDAVTTAQSSPRQLRIRRDAGSRMVHVTGSLPIASAPWKDAITIPQPALYFVHLLREELIAAGIKVRGSARHDPGARQRLAMAAGVPPDRAAANNPRPRLRSARNLEPLPQPLSIPSPPLATLVTAMMKPSQNLYAQLLLLQVGARRGSSESPSTEEAGIAALRSFLDHAGIPRDEVQLDDGSGLSRSSLVTPAAIVALLRFMDAHPHREAFLNSLPVAGRDGSLRQRFQGTHLEGNLRAKTGGLRYVHTLSGFLTNTTGQRLVFSAFLNAYAPPACEPPAPSGRDALEGLVSRLAEAPIPASP